MPARALFAAAGSLRELYQQVDWASTPLGPVDRWSPTLRHALDLTLHTRFPVTLVWGPEHVLLYNEAYAPLIAGKHPAALGAGARETFPEVWAVLGPMVDRALRLEPTYVEDMRLPLWRNGFLEDCYFTFSYSAVRGDDGAEGIIDIATETTRNVLDRRRLQLLNRVSRQLADLEDLPRLPRRALGLLRTDPEDVPGADVRLDGHPSGLGDPTLPDVPGVPVEGDVVLEQTPTGRVAWLPLGPAASSASSPSSPSSGSSTGRPLLVVRLSDQLPADEDYLSLLRLVARSLSQALDRIQIRASERSLSETLQRSLLGAPASLPDVEVAVRYQPAAARARVGGDWYDAFVLPDGSLTVVVGDVSGHDQQAAADMSQVRNLLRGVASTLRRSPAPVLTALDRSMDALDLDMMATAVLAQVTASETHFAPRELRWSNAGHLPPVLISPDGAARLLETDPDPLLGLLPETAGCGTRRDHVVDLPAGATVVLYTDGLVERRGISLTDSLDWLRGALEGVHDRSPDEICDGLLGQLAPTVEDDVALLVLQARRG